MFKNAFPNLLGDRRRVTLCYTIISVLFPVVVIVYESTKLVNIKHHVIQQIVHPCHLDHNWDCLVLEYCIGPNLYVSAVADSLAIVALLQLPASYLSVL